MSSGFDSVSDQLCYVHCHVCNTVLAVSVPSSSMYKVVTVKCGSCTNLLQVNLATMPPQSPQSQIIGPYDTSSASSSITEGATMAYPECEDSRSSAARRAEPERKARVPSAYNRFIKEEIQRIKSSNPEISHREAFSTAAKNWAHIPNIQMGLMDGRRQARAEDDDEVLDAEVICNK